MFLDRPPRGPAWSIARVNPKSNWLGLKTVREGPRLPGRTGARHLDASLDCRDTQMPEKRHDR